MLLYVSQTIYGRTERDLVGRSTWCSGAVGVRAHSWGAFVAAPTAFAGGNSPAVSFTAGPMVAGSSVSLGYGVNRNGKAVASQSCTLSDGASSTEVACGTLTSSAKTKPATFAVTLTGLAEGTYSYAVTITLGDGGRASATSEPFTVGPTCYQESRFGGGWDGRLTSPLGQVRNWSYYPSTDGTCTGAAYGGLETIVQAETPQSAAEQCGAVAGTTNASRWDFYYAAVPSNWYFCNNRGG